MAWHWERKADIAYCLFLPPFSGHLVLTQVYTVLIYKSVLTHCVALQSVGWSQRTKAIPTRLKSLIQSAVQQGGNVTFHSNIFISVLGIKDSEVCFGFAFLLFLLSCRKRKEEIASMYLRGAWLSFAIIFIICNFCKLLFLVDVRQ